MPRTSTDAVERTEQNRRLVEEVSAELGRKVTRKEAEMYRRMQNNGGASLAVTVGDLTAHASRDKDEVPEGDRVLDLQDAKLIDIGIISARVRDMKVIRGGLVSLSIVASPEFAYTLTRAGLVQGNPLIITLQELDRGITFDQDQGDDDGD